MLQEGARGYISSSCGDSPTRAGSHAGFSEVESKIEVVLKVAVVAARMSFPDWSARKLAVIIGRGMETGTPVSDLVNHAGFSFLGALHRHLLQIFDADLFAPFRIWTERIKAVRAL